MKRRRSLERGRCLSRFVLPAVVLLLLVVSACAEGSPVPTTVITMNMDGTSEGENGHDHEHDDSGRDWKGPPPVLELRIDEWPDGHVAVLDASGFSFGDPATEEYVPGVGHTHVYVDGRLLEMSYQAAVPLGELAPGKHYVEVTLAAGDHADYVMDGKVLGAAAVVEVAGEVQPADLAISVDFADGVAEISEDRFEVARHGIVEIAITSDVADEVHVHGYDIRQAVAAGDSTTLRFTADIPGVFEVELEESGHPLFELTVN